MRPFLSVGCSCGGDGVQVELEHEDGGGHSVASLARLAHDKAIEPMELHLSTGVHPGAKRGGPTPVTR